MKGKVLGFDEKRGTGAILAEDGTRHAFARADWRAERSPLAGMNVDFEAEDGHARDVYPLGGATMAALSNMNLDLSGLASSPQGERLAGMFRRSLALPLAILVLIACFMSALNSPMMSVNLFDLGKVIDGLNLAGASLDGTAGGSGLGALGSLLFLRFLAPLTALWLIWTAWTGKPERLAMLMAGASSIGAALLVIGLKSAALSMVPTFLRPQFSAAISLGAGVWLLLLAGAGLIAAGLGKVRNPLADRSGLASLSATTEPDEGRAR